MYQDISKPCRGCWRAWTQYAPWQYSQYSKVVQCAYKHSGFFSIYSCNLHPNSPYHGQASEIPWRSHWYSVHHSQQYHNTGFAEHHAHCQFGRSLHVRYPSGCCPLSPWRWSCWIKERMTIYNCDRHYFKNLSETRWCQFCGEDNCDWIAQQGRRKRNFRLKIMELNIAERFPLLDADAANTFIHLSSVHYYRQVRRSCKSETTTCKEYNHFRKFSFSYYIIKVK